MSWRNKILSKVKPTESEENKLKSVQIRVIETVKKYAKSKEVICVGSTAKDTWLKGTNDIDIFVKFPIDTKREDLEKEGLDIGKNTIKELKGKYVIAYAEHPYTRGEVSGFKVEIVPCYSVESAEKIQSAVDRSPFHLDYVNSKLSFGNRDDVRILKSFLKAHELYGADLKTEGFSGYLCELLIIAYGTFEKLIEDAKSWTPGKVIDLKHKANLKEPLVLIDPVDPKRNVASAVSAENLIKFINLCKEFSSKPSEKFFEKKEIPKISLSQLNKILTERKTELVTIKFKKPDILDDILYPQLRRFSIRTKDILKHHGFLVLRSDFLVDEKDVYLLLEMEISTLSNMEKKHGPLIFHTKHSEEFLSKYKKPLARYIENNVWIVEVPRKFTSALDKIEDFLNDKEIILKEKGVPSYIAQSIAKSFSVLGTDKTKLLIKDNNFSKFLWKYFNKLI